MRSLILIPLIAGASWCAKAQDSALINQIEKSIPAAANDSLRAAAYMQLFVAWRNYDSSRAIAAINRAIASAGEFGNRQYLGKLMLNKANFLNINGSPRDAVAIMDEVLQMAKASNDNGLAGHTLRSRGIVEFDKNNYDAALQYFLEAASHYSRSTDRAGEAGNYIWMGNVQNEGLKRHADAISSFQTSYRIASSLNDSALMSYSLNNMGQAYYYSKNPDSSLHYYMRSLDIKRRQPDLHALGNVYSNISNIYHEKADYVKALLYNDSSLVIRKSENDRKGMATSYLNAANSLLKLKRYSEAITNYTQALAIAQDAGFKEGVYETYAGLAAWHEANGNLGEALRYQRLHKQLYDSVYNKQVGEQIATLERQYETARKEQQITEQQYAINRRNTMLMFSGALLVLGGLLGYSGFRRFRLKKEKQLQETVMQQQELATKAVMEAEESERRRIARELHDGVGQMMSAARMNLSAFEEDVKSLGTEKQIKLNTIVGLVDESCREVRTVSHSMMPNALLKKGLAAAIRDFIERLDDRVMQVNFYSEGLDARMPETVETMLYRIVQECVNNVIKHSGANRLDLSVVRDAEGLQINVQDNGRGFSVQRGDEGMGLKNIRSRVQYLKGEVEFDSAAGRGTSVSVYVASKHLETPAEQTV